MSDVVIRLDKSRPSSECRGERTPDDPAYRVHFWQGQQVGKDMVLLPFDAEGMLVPDDGKTDQWTGMNVEGKPVVHFPLYNKPMRDLVARKLKRQEQIAAKVVEEDELDVHDPEAVAKEVNIVAWLRGEARYEFAEVQVAVKSRYHRWYTEKRQMVTDLVLDEKVVTEEDLAPALAKLLPPKQAA